jgi:hypothetical protein
MPGRSSIRFGTLHKTLFVCLLLAPFCAASDNWKDWNYEETHSEAREFVSGGTLHVRLNVGDLQIRRGDSNQIRLRYTVKSRREKNVKEMHVDFEVRGNVVRLEFRTPSGSNTQVDAELEVPQNTNLDVHDKVGDVEVKDIEGDKDLELAVGDIRVVGGRSAYHLVHASTSIGDVSGGDSYGETEGWLGKTLKYHGDGKYELRAHVSVGDITLEGK